MYFFLCTVIISKYSIGIWMSFFLLFVVGNRPSCEMMISALLTSLPLFHTVFYVCHHLAWQFFLHAVHTYSKGGSSVGLDFFSCLFLFMLSLLSLSATLTHSFISSLHASLSAALPSQYSVLICAFFWLRLHTIHFFII